MSIYILIIKNYFTLKEINKRSFEIFGDAFNDKLFRTQLAYHNDIDYSEKIEYLINGPEEKEIKEFLIEISLS